MERGIAMTVPLEPPSPGQETRESAVAVNVCVPLVTPSELVLESFRMRRAGCSPIKIVAGMLFTLIRL